MILKLGRVENGNITETLFTRSQEMAISVMLSRREFDALAGMVDQFGPAANLFTGPGSLANDANAALAWKEGGWSDYLNAIPMADNPIYQTRAEDLGASVHQVDLFAQLQRLLAEREHFVRVAEVAAHMANGGAIDDRSRFALKMRCDALAAWRRASNA